MKYDFTTLPDRTDKGQGKYKMMENINPSVDPTTVPLTVADMDFVTMPEVSNGLIDYIDNGAVFGYSTDYEDYRSAIKNWFKTRYNYHIEDEWLVYTPGVVSGFTGALRGLLEPGDGVIIMKPVYPPMTWAIESSGLIEENVPLLEQDMEYTIDFDKLEKAGQNPNNKALFLCSPHNPVGRVWTKEELEKIAQICIDHDLYIISDEIWMDIIPGDTEHTMIASLSDEVAQRTITATAPSKTFNLAGLATSNIIVPNPEIREKLQDELEHMRATSINTLGWKACELAYTYGEQWLEEMTETIRYNENILKDFFKPYGIKTSPLEGTYVVWVDFRSLDISDDQLYNTFEQDLDFFVNHGSNFGPEGVGMARVNIALPSYKLKEELEKIKPFLEKQKK